MYQAELSLPDRKRLIALCKTAVANFSAGDWQTLGAHTGQVNVVTGHDRLLRSLSFGDTDYAGNAHSVLFKLVELDHTNLGIIADYITSTYGDEGENVSTAPSRSRSIIFAPSVFEAPEGAVERNLIAVMTPFAPQFESVFDAITAAAAAAGFRTLRHLGTLNRDPRRIQSDIQGSYRRLRFHGQESKRVLRGRDRSHFGKARRTDHAIGG